MMYMIVYYPNPESMGMILHETADLNECYDVFERFLDLTQADRKKNWLEIEHYTV